MKRFLLILAALLIAGGVTITIRIGGQPAPEAAPPVIEGLPIEDAPADVDGPEGWSGVESLTITAAWAAQQPAFQLIHPDSGEPVWQDNANARVCQWETQAALIGGELPPNVPQEIGDCTSQGAATAIERMQSGGGIRGPPAEFREVSTMWLYGVGRVWIAQGRFGPGDGCSGAAIAQAARDYGVLPLDTPGLPSYSGATAREWGRKGPPEQFKAIAAQYRVKTVSRLRSAGDVRDAVCNDHGVTIASDWGTANSVMRVRDGRIVAVRHGRWMHQMCVDGYDGSVPGRRYYHITNSWGPNLHPQPIDGSPPGGFWVEEKEIEYIVAQGDTWAYSDFDGFPARLDVSPLRPGR
ncbi:MAG TPA: hypothetical protein VL132_15630 [Planctomycetaceae bacterium]|nr:hypothetical protein [Planctomycetaceae bacterium]